MPTQIAHQSCVLNFPALSGSGVGSNMKYCEKNALDNIGKLEDEIEKTVTA
jgi:hypothetical protein